MSNTRKVKRPDPHAPPEALDQRATRVAERAYEAWFSCRGSGDDGIPLSVLAAFMLAGGINAKHLMSCKDTEVVQGVREMWTWFWIRRPDLCQLCGPIAGWINEETIAPDLTRAIAHTARAAVKAGVCDLLGDTLRGVDLLGRAYMQIRTNAARGGLGEFYTPASACDLMASMILDSAPFLREGMSIAEPAAGSGGMLRAAAAVIRRRGLDPAGFWWVVNDLAPAVVAMLAVNCHVWGLGPNVVLGVADSLADPGWPKAAWEAQRDAVGRRDELMRHATMLALLKGLDRMVTGGMTAPEPASGPPPAPGPVPVVPDVELPADGALFDLDTDPAEPITPVASRRRTYNNPARRAAADGDPDELALF